MLRLAVLSLLLCGLSLGRASAQDAGTERYRALVDAALEESGEGRWEEARALFRQAHELSPNARTLRGIGMASYELRDYTEAVRALGAALASEVNPLTEEQRAQVTDLLSRANAFVARYEVELPTGTRLTVDGTLATLEPDQTLLVTLGRHHLVARNDDGEVVEADVEVRGGESGALPLDLARLAPHDDATVLAEPVAVPVPRETEPNVAPWIVVGIGGAAAIAGAVCLGVGLADASAIENAERGTPWSSVAPTYDRVPVLEGVGGALVGVGVAAAVGGVIWGVAEPSHEVSVSVGLGGVVVRGHL